MDADPCIYKMGTDETLILLGIYVDDLILISKDKKTLLDTKRCLSTQFRMKDLGPIHHCLGIEFKRNEKGFELSQKKYINDVLERYNMKDCKPIRTPVEVGAKLNKPDKISELEMSKYPFRSLIGSLTYLSVATRPDLSYAVSSLRQFNNCYSEQHWKAAKRILRYLKGTQNYTLRYEQAEKSLEGFVDADWGNCIIDRKSYTGYAFIYGGAAISWEARKQRTVAHSSVEAEYMALSDASKEAVYLRRFLAEIKGNQTCSPTVLWSDSQGARRLVYNPVYHSRTKHIDIRHHYIREEIKKNEIKVEYMSSEEMTADVLTKPLSGDRHMFCSELLGLIFNSDTS